MVTSLSAVCITGLHNYGGMYLVQVPVKELDKHCPLQAVEEEKTEEQKNVDKSRPVSSTPVPGTPWSVLSLCLFLSALHILLSHRSVIVGFSPNSLSVCVITIYPPPPCLSLSLFMRLVFVGGCCQISWSNKIVSAIICYCWKVVFIFLIWVLLYICWGVCNKAALLWQFLKIIFSSFYHHCNVPCRMGVHHFTLNVEGCFIPQE